MHGDPRRHVPLPDPARRQPADTHTGTHDKLRFWYRYGGCRPGRHQISPQSRDTPRRGDFLPAPRWGPPPWAPKIAVPTRTWVAPKQIAFSKIGAHAHAEEAEPGAPGDLAQQREMRCRLLVERRNAHQAFDRQAEPVAALDDEVIGHGRKNPRLLRLFAGTDLDQAGRAPTSALHLPGQRLGEPRPVDGFDHVAKCRSVAYLVGLQRPDQVQGEVGKRLASPEYLACASCTRFSPKTR